MMFVIGMAHDITLVADAVQHFNNGGSVVVHTRGHNVLYVKRWHTEAVLTSAIQESDSFNCVGEILC